MYNPMKVDFGNKTHRIGDSEERRSQTKIWTTSRRHLWWQVRDSLLSFVWVVFFYGYSADWVRQLRELRSHQVEAVLTKNEGVI